MLFFRGLAHGQQDRWQSALILLIDEAERFQNVTHVDILLAVARSIAGSSLEIVGTGLMFFIGADSKRSPAILVQEDQWRIGVANHTEFRIPAGTI